jgi:mannose-6-phosphate isomerase
MDLLRFEPIYKERVWGGRALADRLGRSLPRQAPIGEAWEIVDREDSRSVDPDSGRSLRELIESDPEAIMGPGYPAGRPFPVLVKWLDCAERLSLQVHPPAGVAERLGGEPKTECWYIADATPEAALIVGLREGVTEEQFGEAIESETLEPLLHRFPVAPGQSMLLEAGRLHAIDAGNLILEIQQNSDTTYRVYDWGRVGLDGKPRDLHVRESLESIDFDDFEPEPTARFSDPGERVIAECGEFRIRQINLEAEQQFEHPAGRQPMIVSVVAGRVIEPGSGRHYEYGDNLLAPYAAETRLQAANEASLLVTDRFFEPAP